MALWIGATTAYGSVLGWLQLTTRSFVLPTVTHALLNVVSMAFAQDRGDALDPVWAGTGGLAAILNALALGALLFNFFPPSSSESESSPVASDLIPPKF